jgi:hypothetical protein
LKGEDHLGDRGVGLTLENNIKMGLEEIYEYYNGVDWIHLAQNRVPWRVLVNMLMNHYN